MIAGKVVVVTGAGGALGRAVAEAAAAQGARVALVGHGGLDAVNAGADALRYGGVELSDLAAAKAVMDDVQAKAGRLDALLNIAGGFRWQTLADGDLATWDALFKKNVMTAASACKAALPHLIASGDGRIVNVGAQSAMKAGAGMGAYAASKAGVAKLTESLAEELKAANVTVNAVLPSIIDTPANRADMPNADHDAWVAPADIAAVMLFLISAEARAVTGALIPVSGKT